MFAQIQFLIMEVPSGFAHYFEQLMLSLCYTGPNDFGEFRTCGKVFAEQCLNRLHTIVNSNNGHGINPFRQFRGKMDFRTGRPYQAQRRPGRNSLFYILDIPLVEGLGLTHQNISQLHNNSRDFWELLTMVKPGISFAIPNAGAIPERVRDYLYYLPIRRLRMTYIRVLDAPAIENHISLTFTNKKKYRIGGRVYNHREWIHDEATSYIQLLVLQFINVTNRSCLTAESQFTPSTIFERHILRNHASIPSSLFVLALSLGHATTHEIQHMMQNGISMYSPDDRILFMNNQFVSTTPTVQMQYVSIVGGELDMFCCETIINSNGVAPRILNANESNWTSLRIIYSQNQIDRQRIGVPQNQWTKQHCLLNHFLYYRGTPV